MLSGESVHSTGGDTTPVRSRVVWCRKRGVGYRVGLVRAPEAQRENPEPPLRVEPVEVDHYEVLQLSPNADQETVQRVYRLLAQRYHPDHAETGDSEMFQRVVTAFQVLGDPERRAAYDVDYQMTRRLRWKIFDQPGAAQGLEAEKRKRKGILGLLYAKRVHQPDRAGMSLIELEDLLGVPREHLEFSMWYLKDSGLVSRGDNGRYAITVKGVDEAEKEGQVSMPRDRLLPEGSHSQASSQI
jgi:curved DNA-binding protein CbpA